MILFLMACGSNVENSKEFSIAYADTQCRAYTQCNRSLFDGEYGTMADCEEEVAESFQEENESLYEGCTYDGERAQECLNLINSSTCGELWSDSEQIYETCHSDVWTCS